LIEPEGAKAAIQDSRSSMISNQSLIPINEERQEGRCRNNKIDTERRLVVANFIHSLCPRIGEASLLRVARFKVYALTESRLVNCNRACCIASLIGIAEGWGREDSLSGSS